MSWFEEWFDSPLYEKLYSNRDVSEAAVVANLVEKELPVSKYPDILDLGCGRGRHSVTLAKRGYNVTGIDLSKKAIQKARNAAEKENLKNIHFQIRDMRNPFPQLFDGIVNLFTTFGYFLEDKENKKILSSTASMLKPDGILFLDYLNPSYVRKNLVPAESGSYEDMSYQITRDIKDNMVYKTIQFSGGKLKKPITYTERVKLYDLEWFLEAFQEVGYELQKTYGNYTGKPHTGDSERMILIAKLKKS